MAESRPGLKPASECEEHFLLTTYTRPWRKLFRKQYWQRCYYCDLKEPVTLL